MLLFIIIVLMLAGLGGLTQSSKASAAASARTAKLTEELLLATAPPEYLVARRHARRVAACNKFLGHVAFYACCYGAWVYLSSS
jgi:hypothetical protein